MAVFMKQPGYLMFAKSWELWLIYQKQVFDFLRTMTMNSKNLPDNQCLLLITAKHWLEPYMQLIYEDLKNLHAAAKCHNNLTTRLERWEKNSWRTGIHKSLLLHMGSIWNSQMNKSKLQQHNAMVLTKIQFICYLFRKKPTFLLKEPAMFWKQKKLFMGFSSRFRSHSHKPEPLWF